MSTGLDHPRHSLRVIVTPDGFFNPFQTHWITGSIWRVYTCDGRDREICGCMNRPFSAVWAFANKANSTSIQIQTPCKVIRLHDAPCSRFYQHQPLRRSPHVGEGALLHPPRLPLPRPYAQNSISLRHGVGSMTHNAHFG